MLEQRFTAVNTAPESENRMHDDAVARRYGFKGGLVPGVTVFGYICDAFEQAQGLAWRSHGWAELRLTRPFYEGETVIVRGEESMGDWVLTAEGEDGGPARATVRLGLLNRSALPSSLPREPLPDPRPEASNETLEPGTILGSITRTLTDASPREMLEAANRILIANYVLEPWIHTASKLQWFNAPQSGQIVEIRAAIDDIFARRGHSMVRYSVSYLAGELPLLDVEHTAIWHLENFRQRE